MSHQVRNQGRYAPSEGFTLPSRPFTGTPLVPCPDVGAEAAAYWQTWARSEFAHQFAETEWRSLSVATVMMDRFFMGGAAGLVVEARQREAMLFGLAVRAKLHVRVDDEDAGAVTERPVSVARRSDPRLRSA